VTAGSDDPKRETRVGLPSMRELATFVLYCGVILLGAWIAGTGRVAYTLVMLLIAAAFAYAVVDLVDYEIVKKKRRT
jgi:hypothetical protein